MNGISIRVEQADYVGIVDSTRKVDENVFLDEVQSELIICKSDQRLSSRSK
jgi:hypothetical protein